MKTQMKTGKADSINELMHVINKKKNSFLMQINYRTKFDPYGLPWSQRGYPAVWDNGTYPGVFYYKKLLDGIIF